MKWYIFMVVFYVICLSEPLHAQGHVDSLKVRLEGTTGRTRLAVLADLIEALHSNDPIEAVGFGREAVTLLQDDSDVDLTRRVWYWKARAHLNASQYDSVLIHAEHLKAWAEAVGSVRGRAGGYYLEGSAYYFMDSLKEGLLSMEAALNLYEELGDRHGVANALNTIGMIKRGYGAYDEALSFYTRALALREELGDKIGIAGSLNAIGLVHWGQGNYDEALSFSTRALALREELGDRRGIAESLNTIGLVHLHQSDYERALPFFTRALALQEDLGNKVGIAYTLIYIAGIHEEQGDLDNALSTYTQALALNEELGDRVGTAYSLDNIGLIHWELGAYAEALSFNTRALTIFEELGDKRGVAIELVRIGKIYKEQGAYDDALSSYMRALSLHEEVGNKEGRADALGGIGEIYKEQGAYEEALVYYQRALALQGELGKIWGLANSLNATGAINRQLGHLDAALTDTERALALADSIGALTLVRDAYAERTLIFEQQGHFAEALHAHRAYKAIYDSLFSSESQTVIAELQQQYKSKEQRQQILLLERGRQVQRLWLGGLSGGVLFMLFIAFLLHNRFRLKNRAHAALSRAHTELQGIYKRLKFTQAQLIQQEKMASLGQLTAGIAHEIKNPLNFINNFAEVNEELADELLEASQNGEDLEAIIADLKQNAFVIKQHGKRADGIVRAMMQHASSGSGQREAVDLNALVSEHIDLAYHGKRAQLPDLAVDISRDLDESVETVEVVPQEIGRVLLNLLGNAFDAVHEHAQSLDGAYTPTVTVRTRHVDGKLEIRVSDNGSGIAEEIRSKIFEPFFTTKPTGTGTGLGLSLSYDIVTQGHGGTLTVESTEGEGATFIITLPHEAKPTDGVNSLS